jgi:hypothetical protein
MKMPPTWLVLSPLPGVAGFPGHGDKDELPEGAREVKLIG